MNELNENIFARIGMPAPDFALPSETGDQWRLSNQSGKIVVLLFIRKRTKCCRRFARRRRMK